jgi:Wnt-binding factor required for Wnt secretion
MIQEKVVKLRLEHETSQKIFKVVCLAVVCFVCCGCVALYQSPRIVNTYSLMISKCSAASTTLCYNQETSEIYLLDIEVQKSNQFVYLQIEFESNDRIQSSLVLKFTVTGRLGQSTHQLVETNQNVSISCENSNCDTVTLFYIPYISYTTYLVDLQIVGVIPTDSIEFSLKCMNQNFIYFLLSVKYIFLMASIISYAYFVLAIKAIPYRYWSYQTKLVGIISISLIIFNEPLLYFNISFPGPEWSSVSVFCNVQFMAFLIIYWLGSLQQFTRFKYKKLAITIESVFIVILFTLVFLAYLYANVNLKYDPVYDWRSEFNETNKNIFIGVLVFTGLFILWIGVLTVWSFANFLTSDFREKIFKGSNTCMMVFTFVGIYFGSFQPIPSTATLFLISVGLFNIYFIMLQWLYTPSLPSYLEYKQVIESSTGRSIPSSRENDDKITT